MLTPIGPAAGSPAIADRAAITAPAAKAAPPASAAPLYGVTLDRVSRLTNLLANLKRLPHRPTVRVYFDVHKPASHYASAVTRIAKHAEVMGELLDSSEERAITVAGVRARTRSYLRELGRHVAIWEVGNEVNGNWTGRPATVSKKFVAAFDSVKAHNGRTALTLYANDFGPNHCGDGKAELTPLEFARRWIPRHVRDALDYVLLSYYPTQCADREPTSGAVAKHLKRLHAVFPNSALGFGEVGLPHPATSSMRAQAAQLMRWAYSLHPRLAYYVGGYFWWYAAQDALGPGAPLKATLRAAFKAEQHALAR